MTSDHDQTLNEVHKQHMKQQQAAHRNRMKQKKKTDRGLLLVHTGHGKGKSTAAFGTVARALGWGWKVGIVQFIKGKWKTGEKQFFSRFDEQVTLRIMGEGFTWDTQNREQDIRAAHAAWSVGVEMMTSGAYQLVVLDELNIVLRYNYLPHDEVIAALLNRHPLCNVIATGRDAPATLLAAADQVTEMKNIKHPFEAGIKPVRGIDF
ncbi:cob(I)yrinic acid a,c-diamide adenosyltransferase [Luteithermobacter gelatinilyticus]|uniref:cob(I)yrinic acid a,c-diamide adenosyltransferase n=1 Tax=Luteithermobacter gelatinilyticus TaxID=2582913 RepID=UPI0011070639|nr:cob(I)yrinic acid a,c-diamide adenosyltransferase [Luteithermobacter gelatinilyticus]